MKRSSLQQQTSSNLSLSLCSSVWISLYYLKSWFYHLNSKPLLISLSLSLSLSKFLFVWISLYHIYSRIHHSNSKRLIIPLSLCLNLFISSFFTHGFISRSGPSRDYTISIFLNMNVHLAHFSTFPAPILQQMIVVFCLSLNVRF